MNSVKKNKKKGFTLIELMIVIVIMVILAAAAAPVFTGYVEKAAASKHLADCHSIYTAASTAIAESAAKDVAKGDAVATVGIAAIKDEIAALTGITVEASASALAKDHYTLTLTNGKNEGDQQIVESVIYSDGKKIWTFNPEDGTYLPGVIPAS